MRFVALLLLCACAAAPASEPAFLGNAVCPFSGDPVLRSAFYEYNGQRVYFCNPECAKEGVKDPQRWLAAVYDTVEPVGNTRCPVSEEELGEKAISVDFQGRAVGLCCPGCKNAFWADARGHTAAALGE